MIGTEALPKQEEEAVTWWWTAHLTPLKKKKNFANKQVCMMHFLLHIITQYWAYRIEIFKAVFLYPCKILSKEHAKRAKASGRIVDHSHARSVRWCPLIFVHTFVLTWAKWHSGHDASWYANWNNPPHTHTHYFSHSCLSRIWCLECQENKITSEIVSTEKTSDLQLKSRKVC